MKVQAIVIVIHSFVNGYSTLNYSYGCGVDKSSANMVNEGMADVETYPWLGVLFYPINQRPVTTTVVLITTQLVLGAALDIDRYPKTDFRTRAKIILGHNCSGPKIGIRDYTYHPDYAKTTYSALTIIQLDTRLRRLELYPICPPPTFFKDDQVYAMTLSHKCSSSMVRIYKMKAVNSEECREYYRKFDLDVESMWPTHFACAKAEHDGNCVWHSGTVLVIQQNKKWKLMGFGVSGPGCGAPARFLDYGMHHQWVRNSIARIGRPAISRIAPNRIVMRRTFFTLQRFGECDPEEMITELFSDTTAVTYLSPSNLHYNVTLLANVEYNCIVLEVTNNTDTTSQPLINLRRWCTSPYPKTCWDHNLLQIDFYVHIVFDGELTYKFRAYGQEIKLIDGKKLMAFTNRKKKYPEVPDRDPNYVYSSKEFVTG